MSGLFLLCGGVAVAALLMGLAARLVARGCPGRGLVRPSGAPKATGSSRTLDHTATEGELLRLLLAKVERLQEQQQEAKHDSERSGGVKTEPAPMPKPGPKPTSAKRTPTQAASESVSASSA